MSQGMAKLVFAQMNEAIEDIYQRALPFAWENEVTYAHWLAQSYYYVARTTRLLALASARTELNQDNWHWRFVEEAREEKAHEKLILKDLEGLGYSLAEFPELPHSGFFYQSLYYMVDRVSPVSILGYSLTLEGFAAKKASLIYPRLQEAYGEKVTTFFKVHCELDVEHFANALPFLKSCNEVQLEVVSRGIRQCSTVYRGILDDITQFEAKRSINPMKDTILRQPELTTSFN